VEHNLQRHPYATVSTLCTSHIHGPRYLNTILLLTDPYTFLMKYPLKLVESRIPAMSPSILLHPYTFLMKYPLKLLVSRIPAMAPSIRLYITHVTLTQVEPNLQRHTYAPVTNLWTPHIHRPRKVTTGGA
jgi:hypothetical protein